LPLVERPIRHAVRKAQGFYSSGESRKREPFEEKKNHFLRARLVGIAHVVKPA
jgi:hypothetical protein